MEKHPIHGSQEKKHISVSVPNNYLAFAILCTLICFAPVGVFSLFYSLRVNQYIAERKFGKARHASMMVRILCIWTIIAGIIFWIGILSGALYNIFGEKKTHM